MKYVKAIFSAALDAFKNSKYDVLQKVKEIIEKLKGTVPKKVIFVAYNSSTEYCCISL